MMNLNTAVKLLVAVAFVGSATTAHAQGRIDTSAMSGNSNNTIAPSGGIAFGLKGARNPIPGEPQRVVAIPEPGTGLLALSGAAMLGFAVVRTRRRK